jgi:DNA-binding FadR family transcriptional regulator
VTSNNYDTPIKARESSPASAVAIAQNLRQQIFERAYAHGQRLPAERRLAELFGASRSTIREALRRLEESELVTRRIGSGTYVNLPARRDEEDIAEITSPLELVEVRMAIEPEMTRLAVLKTTARDIERLADALSELERSGEDSERFSRWDEQFHLRIAEASHNPLFLSIYRRINHVRSHRQWNAIKGAILSPAQIARYNVQHRKLYDAIRSRDVEAAVRLITEHLDQAWRDLVAH